MSNQTFFEKKTEWEEKFCNQRESKLSIEEWCRQNQISSSKFHYWKDRLFPKTLTKSCFTEISSNKKKDKTAVCLKCDGISIRINKDFDMWMLKKCVEILKEITC